MIRPAIVLANGVSLSVQTSSFHYCSPRTDLGRHHEFEVGFIQDKKQNRITPPETWRKFADGDFPNDVYGYVPKQLIEDFIASQDPNYKFNIR
jgi:hypothetical protein